MFRVNAMATLQKILFLSVALMVSVGSSHAASSGENNAYRAATLSLNLLFYPRAEKEFAEFLEKYPKSDRRIEATLLQAESRYYQSNYDGTISLLEAGLDGAEGRADEYRFWIAEANFQKGDYANAAAGYARLLSMHGASKRRLESLVGEAASRARLGESDKVIALLGRTDGEFAYAMATSVTNEIVIGGLLLLAEAHLAKKNPEGIEHSLSPLAKLQLDPSLNWRAEHLRCAAQRIANRLPEALATSSNLVALAGRVVVGRAPLLAESIALQATILGELQRHDEAVGVWKQNLASGTPENRRREALLKAAQISIAQRRLVAAEETLQKFLTDNPKASASDAAMLTLGELELKQSVTNGPAAIGGTNHLERAMNWFARLTNDFPNSPLIGKAELNVGWCYWLQEDFTNSAAAFTRAIPRLSEPEDLAVARYKLGDALFKQENFAWARENYRAAVDFASRASGLRETLPPLAWRQILRSDIKLKNEAGAIEAMSRILKLPLGDGIAEGAMLEIAQSRLDDGQPTRALVDLENFISLFPNATNRADAELLIAQTRELQSDWAGAVTNYTQWIERYPTNGLRPQAEFQRAVAIFRSGDETNALMAMTNFIAVFQTNSLAPRAMWWLGDFYFRRGDAFPEAEKNYKLLFQTWPKSDLADEAIMMAGRAAVAWGNYDNAIEHFNLLTANLASSNWVQAMFAFGDTLMLQAARDTNKSSANYAQALLVLGKIPEEKRFLTNEIAAFAWGEMAKCYRQMGGSTGLSNAEMAYRKVIEFPAAGAAARSQAQVGLGLVLKDMARTAPPKEQHDLLKSAANNFWDVVLEKNLRDGETHDLFWIKNAGLEGAQLLEATRDWERLLRLCERMKQLLPVLNARWQRYIEDARRGLELENN
jgi:TolA-binding protein